MRYTDELFIDSINQATDISKLIELRDKFEQDKLHEISRQSSNQNVIDMYTFSIKVVEDRIKYLTEHLAD